MTASACPIGQLKLPLTTSCHACDIPPKNANRETSVPGSFSFFFSPFPPSLRLVSRSRIKVSRRFRPAPILILFYQNSSGVSCARLSFAREISQCHNSSAGCTERSIWIAVTVYFSVDLSSRERLMRLALTCRLLIIIISFFWLREDFCINIIFAGLGNN